MDEDSQGYTASHRHTFIYAKISLDRKHRQPSKAYIDLLASFLTTIPISAYFRDCSRTLTNRIIIDNEKFCEAERWHSQQYYSINNFVCWYNLKLFENKAFTIACFLVFIHFYRQCHTILSYFTSLAIVTYFAKCLFNQRLTRWYIQCWRWPPQWSCLCRDCKRRKGSGRCSRG